MTFEAWWDDPPNDGPTPDSPVSKETARWIWDAALSTLPAASAQPVAWAPRAIADSEHTIVGEFKWDELAEKPFEMNAPDIWQCCALYAHVAWAAWQARAAQPAAEPVAAPTVFARMEDGHYATEEAEEKIAEILGVELLGIGFDWYDGSFDIFPDREVEDVTPTEGQHAAILALGCIKYWINFADSTQRFCRGERVKVTHNRWHHHNTFTERRRSEVAELERFRAAAPADALDARRYRWLRDQMWAQALSKVYALPIIWGVDYPGEAGKSMDAAIDAQAVK